MFVAMKKNVSDRPSNGVGALRLALPLLLVSQIVGAQSGGVFEITKHTIDAGGGESSGGLFELNGTIAQADAAPSTASGGGFQLTGGFWANGLITPPGELLFSDGFETP